MFLGFLLAVLALGGIGAGIVDGVAGTDFLPQAVDVVRPALVAGDTAGKFLFDHLGVGK